VSSRSTPGRSPPPRNVGSDTGLHFAERRRRVRASRSASSITARSGRLDSAAMRLALASRSSGMSIVVRIHKNILVRHKYVKKISCGALPRALAGSSPVAKKGRGDAGLLLVRAAARFPNGSSAPVSRFKFDAKPVLESTCCLRQRREGVSPVVGALQAANGRLGGAHPPCQALLGQPFCLTGFRYLLGNP